MSKKKPASVEAVEREHIGLRAEMVSIHDCLHGNISSEEFSEWRLKFMWQMRDFKNRLLKHFDLEEEGGFMNDVISAAPHSERQVAGLKEEHNAISSSLDSILAKLKAMAEHNVESLEGIRTDLAGVFAVLREHENTEHQLMQRAFYREYGGPE